MRKTLKHLVVIGQVMVWLACAATALAGEPPVEAPQGAMPGAVERSLQERDIPAPSKMPEISVQEESGATLKGGEGVEFRLSKIRFEGQRVFSNQDLQEVVAGYLGTTIEVSQLKTVADEVTKFYKGKGYFLSRAYIPPQSIKNGEVLIKVREGRLGEIIIKGNKRYSRELLRNTLKVIRGEGAVRTADVERGLLLLTDIPGLSVKATFKPGERPGTSDIVLDVTEERMFTIAADFNNFGSEYVSTERFGLAAEARNISGYGDNLAIRGVTGMGGPDELIYGRAEYTIPVGSKGLKASAHYEHLDYELGQELEILNFNGRVNQGGVKLSYPIIRGRYLNWDVWGGLDAKNVNNKIDNQLVGKDKLRFAHVGTSVQWLDTFGGANYIGVTGYQNFAGVLGGTHEEYKETIKLNTEIVYSKVTADASRIQQIPFGGMALMLYGHGQYSHDRLPSSEQISIGGANTVRGYAQSEYSGDTGYFATAELRVPIPFTQNVHLFGAKKSLYEIFQIAGFTDYGRISINKNLIGERAMDDKEIWGAGAGIRLQYSPSFRLKVDWAKTVGGQEPKDEDIDNDGAWYIQCEIKY